MIDCVGSLEWALLTGRAMRFVCRLPIWVAILLAFERPAEAFDGSTQVWGGVFVQSELIETSTDGLKLLGWLEAQPRRNDVGTIALLRGAVGVAISSNIALHAGYGFIGRYVDEGDAFIEHRLWQQLTVQKRLDGTLDLSARFRFEERFGPGEGPIGARARALGRIAHYFSPEGPVFLVIHDEAFFALNDTTWGQAAGFDQNRLFGGLGFAGILPKSRFELGYMGLYTNRSAPNVDRWDHIPLLAFFLWL